MADLLTRYGPWAVVTGASSGIGREIARSLAVAGFDPVLAARRMDRLESLAVELTGGFGVEVRPVEVDLTRLDAVDVLAEATADIDVGLVVSNAGGVAAGAFLNSDYESQTAFVQLNSTTPMQLSHVFGTRMVERGRGGIILVSSTSAFNGVPYLANYAATKAYQLSLGEGLHKEYGAHGVDVLVFVPGPTRTEMTETDGVDFASMPVKWMQPDDVAAAALRAIGTKAVLVPGSVNRVMRFMATKLMPRRAAVAVWGSMMRKATDDALFELRTSDR